VETFNRSLLLHTESEDIICHKSMKEMEQILQDKGFVRCHTSYIVNLRAVTKIMQNELTMSNGDRLGISRTCSKKFHQNFSMYFHKKYKRGAKE